jgi:hypothetical protein
MLAHGHRATRLAQMHDRISPNRHIARFVVPLTIALTLAFAGTASAAVVTVNDDTTGSGPAGASCGSPNFSTIQTALADVGTTAGSTINVCSGTYTGAVTINTANLTIVGAGPSSTVVQNVGSDAITLDAAADGLTMRDLQVSNSNRGMTTNAAVDNVTLQGVEMAANILRGIEISNNAVVDGWVLDGVNFHDIATGTGIRFRGDATDVTITNSHFDRNDFGITSFTDTAPTSPGVLDNLQVSDTTFDGNNQKGMYFEQLSNSRFERVAVRNSGVTSAFPAGIDVNVKYGDFANIEFVDSTVSGSTGQGLAIKGRNDAPSYSADPASLSNVLLDGMNVTGNAKGVDIGYNVTNATVQRSRIVGNTLWGLLSYVDAGVVDAGDNWWGCNAGPGGAGCDTTAVNGASSVDSSPRLVLALSADPNSVDAGGATSQVTADVTRNSSGQTVSSSALNGRPVSFATDLGSLSSSGGSLAGGLSTTRFTSGADGGTANVSATFDNQTANTQIAVNEPPPDVLPNDPGQGTPGPDELIGGAGGDILDGGAGGDILIGAAGDDILDGGDGADEVLGGVGDDEVIGGAGPDIVEGGLGDDIVNGGSGADQVGGGPGDDEVHGGKGQDEIVGGPGEDDIHAGAGQDDIDSHDGEQDTVSCGKNVDEVDADALDDVSSNCENVV